MKRTLVILAALSVLLGSAWVLAPSKWQQAERVDNPGHYLFAEVTRQTAVPARFRTKQTVLVGREWSDEVFAVKGVGPKISLSWQDDTHLFLTCTRCGKQSFAPKENLGYVQVSYRFTDGQ